MNNMEILAVSFIAGTILIGGFALVLHQKKACKIVVRTDLENFIKVQSENFINKDKFIGEQGQYINSDKLLSDFNFNNWSPSKDVCITIISGDPNNPYDANNPYMIRLTHKKLSNKIFEYNFCTDRYIQKQ